MKKLIYSALKTPDGTILESKHRHDYVEHTDKNGKYYMLDGGTDYIRCSDPGDAEFIQVYDDDPIEKVREYFRWGVNYDKDQNLLPETEWRKLKDLATDHLEVLIDGGWAKGYIKDIMIRELKFRENEI